MKISEENHLKHVKMMGEDFKTIAEDTRRLI